MKRFQLLTLAPVLFGLVSMAQATEPYADEGGALEHYHHEYYSHSYVDPNYHEDQGAIDTGKLSKSKNGRDAGKATIALGGHRRHHRPK